MFEQEIYKEDVVNGHNPPPWESCHRSRRMIEWIDWSESDAKKIDDQ